MRASFGHMERPDNSELRPTVETIRDIEKSTHGSTIGKVYNYYFKDLESFGFLKLLKF